jgi:hypothetical protein
MHCPHILQEKSAVCNLGGEDLNGAIHGCEALFHPVIRNSLDTAEALVFAVKRF